MSSEPSRPASELIARADVAMVTSTNQRVLIIQKTDFRCLKAYSVLLAVILPLTDSLLFHTDSLFVATMTKLSRALRAIAMRLGLIEPLIDPINETRTAQFKVQLIS